MWHRVSGPDLPVWHRSRFKPTLIIIPNKSFPRRWRWATAEWLWWITAAEELYLAAQRHWRINSKRVTHIFHLDLTRGKEGNVSTCQIFFGPAKELQETKSFHTILLQKHVCFFQCRLAQPYFTACLQSNHTVDFMPSLLMHDIWCNVWLSRCDRRFRASSSLDYSSRVYMEPYISIIISLKAQTK